MENEMTRLPMMLCEPSPSDTGRETWRFWCPYCRAYHTHGAEDGHRVAHCHNPASPFTMGGGYMIKLDPRYRKNRRLK
jgi:hypothetical protein